MNCTTAISSGFFYNAVEKFSGNSFSAVIRICKHTRKKSYPSRAERLPHPVVLFGRIIAWGEHRLNKGRHRRLKGALLALTLVAGVFGGCWWLFRFLSRWPVAEAVAAAIVIFFCLAGTTLIREVRMVFEATDRSTDEGRRQVARIVGRDTAELTPQEVRTAALETLAENLRN